MKIEWKSCFKIGATAILVFLLANGMHGFLEKVASAVAPLVAGTVIAYIVNILMMFYERHYFPHSGKKAVIMTRRPVCMILAALSLVGIIALVISLILPQFISCLQLLVSQLPGAFEIAVNKIEKLDFVPEDIVKQLDSINWQERVGEILEMVTSRFGVMMNTLFGVITGVFSLAVGTLLSIVFAFYLLLSKDRLLGQANALIDSYLSPKTGKKTRYIGKVLNESFRGYIVGQSTEAVILGFLCMLGMKILGLPYESMIGALVAFTSLVPVFGAYVGALVGAFIIVMKDPMGAIVFLIFIIVLQQIEGNFIYPRVVGSSIGLPGLWVLAAVTVGGGIFGIPGMLIGVPLTAAIYRIVRHDVRKKVRALKEENDAQSSVNEQDKEPDEVVAEVVADVPENAETNNA